MRRRRSNSGGRRGSRGRRFRSWRLEKKKRKEKEETRGGIRGSGERPARNSFLFSLLILVVMSLINFILRMFFRSMMNYCTTSEGYFRQLVNYCSRNTRQHIAQLVKDTSAKLKQASEADHVTQVSTSKKIADAKLAKDFQAVLKEFQKAQRLAVERETAYMPFVPQTLLPSSNGADEADLDSDKLEQRALLMESRRQEVFLLDNEVIFNEAIIEERDQGMQEIQQQIGEVNEIFKDLTKEL